MKISKYSLEKVTACVMKMWDEGLNYDKLDEVLLQLKSEVTVIFIYNHY
jgi:hypothetical protein